MFWHNNGIFCKLATHSHKPQHKMSTPIVRFNSLLCLLLLTVFSGCDFAPKNDRDASFIGGNAAMKMWLGENTRYPQDAIELGIEGKVYVSFVVATDGSVKNVAIRKFAYPSLDKEALRVVRSMPRWDPAIIGGKPVNSVFNLPISFKLQ
ncbi:MAG: hypothetical protein CHH17_00645 [Candidatus Fluviicola riflensis]|nr:MAG: hypothetical protein CHH17_00645 [Candidatus Fluviicola riflensis]